MMPIAAIAQRLWDVLDISGLSRWMDKFGASIVFFSRLQV